MEIVVCWIVLLTWGLVKGEDFNINCNGDCNRTVANNTTCNVKWVESMPWSNHEKTAPSPTIVSGNWFLYNNGQSLEIGVNITWKQNAAVFNFVQGYLLTMTSLKSMAGRSSKWIFNASVSSQTINRYENLVFNYKCFHYGTKNFIRAGRTYVLDVYAMPVYEEQNEKVFDTIDIKIPDCNSNVEIAESTYCRDEQTDYFYLDLDENESDEVEVTTAAPKDSAPSKLLWLYIVIPLLMLIVTIITVSIYRHRRRKAIVAGSVVILCSRDSHYGEVTSRLATWLKEYMNRDVECNMWRQTDNNILDWCNKQLKEASQVILVCGEKDYEEQIVHSDPFVVAVNRMKSNVTNANFYMVAFHDETKSKFPLDKAKKFVLMKDFKRFSKKFVGSDFIPYPIEQQDVLRKKIEQAVAVGSNPATIPMQEASLVKFVSTDNIDRDSGISCNGQSLNIANPDITLSIQPTQHSSSLYTTSEYSSSQFSGGDFTGSGYPSVHGSTMMSTATQPSNDSTV